MLLEATVRAPLILHPLFMLVNPGETFDRARLMVNLRMASAVVERTLQRGGSWFPFTRAPVETLRGSEEGGC